ncbi:MAG: hypothetical protein M1356_04830 [Gammaproteobacteria bacterium]|nr:hypothetical protein [Gammaproteobacteria bacterium]
MSKQQRILWVSISILLLTIPVWFDAVTLPGDFVYVWRWTDSQIIYESLITVMFLVAAIVAYGLLRKAVGEFAQWKILRIGVAIWIAMIAILVLFSLAMYYAGNQSTLADYDGEGYNVVAMGSGIAEDTEEGQAASGQIFVVMSCDYRGLYKRVIHIDRFVGADDVSLRRDGEYLLASYTLHGRELREQSYDLEALYQQCLTGESPRSFE